MNNLQYIVRDNTRYAMHVAVELCELGDFDSVFEAVKWLMQERDAGNETCEPKWTLQGTTQEFWRCECGNCGYSFGVEDRQSFPWHFVVRKVDVPNFCPECGVKQEVKK